MQRMRRRAPHKRVTYAVPGSKSDAKGKVKEGPMAIAGPTGSDSNAEDAVMGTP